MNNIEQFRPTLEYVLSQGFSETIVSRFYSKVNITESCWIWTAGKDMRGYGYIGRGASGTGQIAAYRLSWIIHFGPIPQGIFVLHDCPGGDNPSCVNPAHLWLGDQHDNMRDASQKGRVRIPHYRGEKHPNHKLTMELADAIRTASSTMTTKEMSKRFGVCSATIWNVVHRKYWI